MNHQHKLPPITGFQLLNQLHAGELGTVYTARRSEPAQDDQEYLVKIFPARYRRGYRRVARRAKFWQRLAHRGLIGLVATGVASGRRPYLVFESVDGQPLSGYLRHNLVNLPTALRWAYELGECLNYLHSQEQAHGLLTPERIIVAWDNRHGRTIRISDSAVAEILGRSIGADPDVRPYLSPERQAGAAAGLASDIYALGVILGELFTAVGVQPKPSQGGQPSTPSLESDDLDSAGIPPALSDTLAACLNADPTQRPSAAQLVVSLEQQVEGIGQPSYIGILGHRGAGKTCYFTALYHVADASPETKMVLADKHHDLYGKGELPSATALSAYRLNFQIRTESRQYDIVTKDYGGELLEGRREDPLAIEAVVDHELLKEKRSEVYEFFQSARAILIMVETLPRQRDLKSQIDYRNEIHSLISLIAQIHEGKRRIVVPIALVLTKWDRLGEPSSDLAHENQRAIDYIVRTDWLDQLYQQLKILCCHFQVFPVCSFIGDRPTRGSIRLFNITAPLVWASDQSEEALLFQAEQIVASDEYSAEDKLAVYWRLLHIEKITDPELRATAQSSLGDLSRKCLDALTAQLAASPEEIDWIINRYRHFLQIRGIEDVERKKARWGLRRYLVRRWGKRALKAIRIAAVVLVAAYILWEVHGYYRVKRMIHNFRAGRHRPGELLACLADYRRWQSFSIPRRILATQLRRQIAQSGQHRLAQQQRIYIDLYQEPLASAPRLQENFSRDDLPLIRARIVQANATIAQYDDKMRQLTTMWNEIVQWSQQFDLAIAAQLQACSLDHKHRQWQHRRQEWLDYGKRLRYQRTMFEAWLELVAKSNHLQRQWQELYHRLPSTTNRNFELGEADFLLEKGRSNRDAWIALRKRLESHLKLYPESPFAGSARQMIAVIATMPGKWRQPLHQLGKLAELDQSCRELRRLYPHQMNRFISGQDDSPATIANKLKLLQGLREHCRKVETAIGQSPISAENARRYRTLCRGCREVVAKHEQRCRYFQLRQDLAHLAQSVKRQIACDSISKILALLSLKLERIAGYRAQLQQWQPPANQLLASDYDQLIAHKQRALEQLAIYDIASDLEKFYRAGQFDEIFLNRADTSLAIREKQHQFQARVKQCRRIEQAIVSGQIAKAQATPFSELAQKCRKALADPIKRCQFFLAQEELDKLVQQIHSAAQSGDSSLRARLEQISIGVDRLRQWTPSGDLLDRDYRKLIQSRDDSAQNFAVYERIANLEKFYRDQGISAITPQANDPVAMIRHKYQALNSRRDQCRAITAAIAAGRIPVHGADAYRELVRRCDRLLEEQEKCCWALVIAEQLRQIESHCRIAISKDDTPETLRDKLNRLTSQSTQLQSIRIAFTELRPGDYWQVQRQKERVAHGINADRSRISGKIELCQRLEQEGAYWNSKELVEDLCRHGYKPSLEKISRFQQQIRSWTYLQRKYGDRLDDLHRKITAMRAKDYHQYQEICDLVRKKHFGDISDAIVKYYPNSTHLSIMRTTLASYRENFSATISVEMKVVAKVDDTGGGKPDIHLTIDGNSYQEDDKECWPAKYFTVHSVRLSNYNFLNVKVIEADPFADDDYGTSTFNIQNLLNDQFIHHTHTCGSDGTVGITLNPTSITPNITLPDFEE